MTTHWERVEDEDSDRPLHERAFAAAGIAFEPCAWWDPAVDWAAYDLVVLRSPWDYSERLDEFLAWLAGVEAAARVENRPSVVRWNLDKHYLHALQHEGVPVIPTEYVDAEGEVRRCLEARGDAEVVVKPAVSAGSRNTGRFIARDPAALQLARSILAEGQVVMIQPFAQRVSQRGEVSLVFFDGAFSHAFRKGPILAAGGGFLGGHYREEISPAEPSSAQRAVAEAADTAVRRIGAERLGLEGPLLYARYDVLALDDEREVLLEAELFEPSFFLASAAGAAERFAAAVERRLEAGSTPLAAPIRDSRAEPGA